MATIKAPNKATALFSTAADWDTSVTVPGLHATTNITITNSDKFSDTFTAPNTTNACTGALVFCPTVGTIDWTLTLQEATVDTAATVTLAVANRVANSWIYLKFATPYVFTAVTAGRYRLKLRTASAGTGTVAASTAGTAIHMIPMMDVNSVPTTNENVMVQGLNGTTTSVVLTMDGTQSFGDGADTGIAGYRTVGQALKISSGGKIVADTAANVTYTLLGSMIPHPGAQIEIGTAATPYPAARTCTFIFNQNGASGSYGFRMGTGSGMSVVMQGAPKSSTTLFYTNYVSGLGTAASPLVTSTAVDWAVGDEIAVGAASASATNYNETEKRFIITKNSSTSYVISSTSGGAETALTYTHSTNAVIVNVQRNIIFKTNSASQAMYFTGVVTNSAETDIDWVRFEACGVATASKNGVYLSSAANEVTNIDYCVNYGALYYGFIHATSKVVHTHSGLISIYNASTASTGAFVNLTGANNKTFDRPFAIANNKMGFQCSQSHNTTYTNAVAIANNIAGTASVGNIHWVSSNIASFSNPILMCNRNTEILVNNAIDLNIDSGHIGDYGVSVSGITLTATTDSYNNVSFNDCLFGAATAVSNYTNQLPGSLSRFKNYNQTTNNHLWYTPEGIGRSTGTGLADTTVRTASSLGVRLAPEEATSGFVWSFQVVARANSAVSHTMYVRKNTAFATDVARIELWLPGSSVADDTYTVSDVTDAWELAIVGANYTGSINELATIKVIGLTTTASAYLYIDDIDNGTNILTALDLWHAGMPVEIMYEQIGDAGAVWAQLTSGFTVSGSVGELVVQTGIKVDDNQALIIGNN